MPPQKCRNPLRHSCTGALARSYLPVGPHTCTAIRSVTHAPAEVGAAPLAVRLLHRGHQLALRRFEVEYHVGLAAGGAATVVLAAAAARVVLRTLYGTSPAAPLAAQSTDLP